MVGVLDRLAKRAAAAPAAAEREIQIPLAKIKFDRTQPRQAFHHVDGQVAEKDEAYIIELAESIRSSGMIHAITVQELTDGSYLVVVGECRTRAHLKLGVPTIRAVVRNDLTNPASRLIFQVKENVNRHDLTDYELAVSIRRLMEGDDDIEPMNQVQIAKEFGKSEGWVSRFVKFGDEELQRVWVQTGIADTVEKLYRLSILPKGMQIDIQRRVNLPQDHREWLEKPLLRSVIDDLAREAKLKAPRANDVAGAGGRQDSTASLPFSGDTSGDSSGGGIDASQDGTTSPSNGIASDDAIGQALAEAAQAGREERPGVQHAELATGGYTLPESARAAILEKVHQSSGQDESGAREEVTPPVNCRVSVKNLEALLRLLQTNDNEPMLSSMRNVRCEFSIPGALAGKIANELMGVIVDDQEVPAVIQVELSKLN